MTTRTTTTHDTVQLFNQAVNMTADELSHWLNTQESQSVGQVKNGESEAIGHQSGKRIVELLNIAVPGINRLLQI